MAAATAQCAVVTGQKRNTETDSWAVLQRREVMINQLLGEGCKHLAVKKEEHKGWRNNDEEWKNNDMQNKGARKGCRTELGNYRKQEQLMSLCWME